MTRFVTSRKPIPYLVYVSGVPDGVRLIPYHATRNSLAFVRQSNPFASKVKRVSRPASLQSIINKRTS